MALKKLEKEIIMAELIGRTNKLETIDFNAAKEDIKKQLVKNSDNKYAQEGLSFMRNLMEHLYDATTDYLKKKGKKLSSHYIFVVTMDIHLPPENPNWLSNMVWTEEAKQEFCIRTVRSLKKRLIQNQRDFTRFVNTASKDKTLSASDKYYYRYYKELNNSIYEIKMKILDEEYAKLLQGAS